MNSERPLRLAIVAGEESGDLLGADLVRALASASGRSVELIGVGGRHLQALGLDTLFDPSSIAIMGASAVVPRPAAPACPDRHCGPGGSGWQAGLPGHHRQPRFQPARRQEGAPGGPGVPIVHYVCPSVWAWRPERAAKMRPDVDRVLCILPFEVDTLARLGGPPGVYVGHRLTSDPGIVHAARVQSERKKPGSQDEKTVLLLPGSRRSEVNGLAPAFGNAAALLTERGHRLRLIVPTVPGVADLVEKAVAQWSQQPEIVIDQARKWQAFGEADAALAASGTVSLELALCRVPLVACYRTDPLMRMFMSLITTWTGSLPNLIADRAVVPEFYDRFIRPGMLARLLEQLMIPDSDARRLQLNGFTEVKKRMVTARRPGAAAADAVLETIAEARAR